MAACLISNSVHFESLAMSLTGKILPVEKVSPERRDEMFRLMASHYDFLRRRDFDFDLAEKDWVIEIAESTTWALRGFSTQMVFDVELDGTTVKTLFSGDTIVDPSCWHRNPLAGLWGRLVLSLVERYEDVELYWFLISKGYKTYRFLPTFFHEFFPRHDVPTPRRVAELLNVLGRHRYAASYDSSDGLVRADAQGCRLRPGFADVTPERLHDPHVRFFLERNPNYARGDELCCLAPLSRENFTRAAYKVIEAVELPFIPSHSTATASNCLVSNVTLSGVAGA